MRGHRALADPEDMPFDGRRFVLHAVSLLASVGVLASTLWVTFLAAFTLDQDGMGPVQNRQAALSVAIGCGLLVCMTVALRFLGAARWLIVVNGIIAAALGLLAFAIASTPARGEDYVDVNPWTWVIGMWAITPTTWPVLLVLLVASVRGGSRLARRSQRDQ
jgi:hypothetical protein